MGKALEDFGYGMAGSAAGGILGLALGGINDRRQREQQQKLQDMQIAGQKEMTEYQRQKQMQMWRDTNYSAQMEQLKMAGLNPGLIYGMSGGGATTTGGGAASGPSGGHAPTGGGEAQAIMGMGMQMQLLKAQKENIEADTANKQADTANKPIQGENIQADTGLKTIQAKIGKIDEWIKGKSKEDAAEIIMWQGEKLLNEVEQLNRQNIVGKATMNDQIDIVKADLAIKYLQQKLIGTQTNQITENIKLIKDELYKTNPEKRKLLSTQMSQIWNAIERHKDDNDGGGDLIKDLLNLIK